MNGFLKVFLIIAVFLTHPAVLSAITEHLVDITETPVTYGQSNSCINKTFGVTFICNPEWEIKTHNNSIIVTISNSPDVTFIIEKLPSRLGFLSQLNKYILEKMHRYAKGFDTEHLRMANRETLKVKAFAKNNTEIRLSEYYLIDHLNLYRLRFAVPKKNWAEYKFMIKRITDSFDFSHEGVL
ncbi:hypothetical protein MNBD_UNCLBAC01-1317 [hydrothermal vent metagenome]|uniref:Uncharacterized protein n=1 Tax=hydrothermal vent metagenome TaxID=652676 RepID=A0A3B1DJ74_9ZZZZ